MFTQRNGFMTIQSTCPTCHGTGKTIVKKCIHCAGTGYISEPSTVTITIPPGSFSGLKLRIPKCGYPGKKGGQSGDGILMITVEENSEFKRIENDLFTTCAVTYSDLLLGQTKELDLFGTPLTIKIPELFNLQEPIVFNNKGFKDVHSKNTGNLIVQLYLKMPDTSISTELKTELLDLESKIYK